MHPNNPFQERYDFKKLVTLLPELNQYTMLSPGGWPTIDFGNQDAVKALNKALLKQHYGLDWNLPKDNLCPPVPGRIDYLLHVADLIDKDQAHLLDIGTGANLIYPILATQQLQWTAVASEVNPDSLEHAQQLINRNPKLEGIALRKQQFKRHILKHIITPEDRFDVVVCNPPFYKNRSEAEKHNSRKRRNLGLSGEKNLNFGGLSNELWYKGGEEAFIKAYAAESANFKTQVSWFTSLVSNKEHLKNIKRAINKTQPEEVRIIEMDQGHKKSRFIAWTYLKPNA